MLWRQKMIVFTDHKNLIHDAPRFTFDHVHLWRLLLEEQSPKIVHIKGIHNTVANAILRLDYGPIIDDKANWMMFMKCWCHYTMNIESAESTNNHQEEINLVFANCNKEDAIYPLTVREIAQSQKNNDSLKKLNKHDKCSPQHNSSKIQTSYANRGKLSSPLLFNTTQSVGTTTTCSVLDIQDLRKHFMPQCIGKV